MKLALVMLFTVILSGLFLPSISGEDANLKLTMPMNSESQWIKKHPSLKFGYVSSRTPFEFVNQDNYMDGINKTVLDFIAAKTSIAFTFHPYPNHLDLLNAVNNNTVDIISTVYEQSKDWHSLNFSQPYWDLSITAISNDGQRYDSIAAMMGKTIAINTDSNYKQYILQMLPEASLIEVDSVATGVEYVTSGYVQIYVSNSLIVAPEIRGNSYNNLTMSIIDSLPLANPRFAIRGDWPQLVAIIDKALLQINNKERFMLFEQWLKHSMTANTKYRELLQTVIPLSIIVMLILGCFIYLTRRLQQEIKLRLALQHKFEHQARHDELTGLPNRARLKEIIESMLEQHRRSGEQLLCLFVNLNNFKPINENYGHNVGNVLLVKVGRRLINRLRHDDFVSRFGGDEFVILASFEDPQLGRDAITKMVRSVCRDPIAIDQLEIRISCSIGSAIFPDDGECFDELINVADRRKYQEKNIQRDGNVIVVAFKERN